MVPNLKNEPKWTSDISVKVMDVIIESSQKRLYSHKIPQLSREEFRVALISTLEKSDLFSDVSTENGDLELHVFIRSYTIRLIGFQETATITVSYKFIDRDGNIVWNESYESEYSSTDLGYVSARHVKILEGSIKENLSAFIYGIRQRWPRN
jgi:hypothetical protein